MSHKFTLNQRSWPHLFAACSLVAVLQEDNREDQSRFLGNEFSQIPVNLAVAEAQVASAPFHKVLELALQDPSQELTVSQVELLAEFNKVLLAVFA
jgi:hypothetical protein